MEIRVDVANAEAISRAFLQAPAMVLDELEVTMKSVTGYLMRETQEVMLERKVVAAGTLRSGWTTQVDVIASLDTVFGRVTNPLPYAIPVELGTKPHFPPLEPLINWVEQKLWLYGDEAEARARAIQRSIGRHGTLGRGMAHTAFAQGQETIRDEFTECAQRITARLAAADGGAGAPA